MVVLCLGCGNAVSRPDDRRALDAPAGQDVLNLWMVLLENEAQDVQLCTDVDINTIVNGRDQQRLPKMCRKCFNGYRRVLESMEIIRRNLLKAAESLKLFSTSPFELLPPSKKKARLGNLVRRQDQPSDDGFQNQSSVHSPDVSVSAM